MNKVTAEQLSALFDELVRTMPDRHKLYHDTDENQEWLARASALIHLADPVRAVSFDTDVSRMNSIGGMPADIAKKIVIRVKQFRTEWSLLAGGPLTVFFDAKSPFDYYDEVRKVVKLAATDLYFADPYLDSDFIARYLPHVKPGVRVRLLGRESVPTLRASATLFSQQFGLSIEVRTSTTKQHDRYIFVDNRECWQSGASFSAGGRSAPTTFTQLVDAFDAVSQVYEDKWKSGK